MVNQKIVWLPELAFINAICNGKYLEYIGSKGQYAFLGKQPEGRYVSSAKKLSNADVGEVVKFGVDPTGPVGGSLLANLFKIQV